MSNVTDYVKWRGDLTFRERPFGVVDNVIFSVLAYLDFGGIVTEPMVMKDALKAYMDQKRSPKVFGDVSYEFIESVMRSNRFKDLKIYNFIDVDSNETEFSAFYVQINPKSVYVSFRGTGNELVGWKEDFAMSFGLVESQRLATEYIDTHDDDEVEHYYFGGHSKGGNLAVYAAATCKASIRKKIDCIYSNDGPGFCEGIVDLSEIQDRIVRVVPEYSVIGSIFELDARTLVVKSELKGLSAHDALFWCVEKDTFEQGTMDEQAIAINHIIDEWLEHADVKDRQTFVDQLFDAIDKSGAKTVSDLANGGVDDLMAILLSVTTQDETSRKMIFDFVKSFFHEFQKIDFMSYIKSQDALQGLVFFIVGMLAFLYPSHALSIFSIVACIGGSLYLAKRLLDTATSEIGTIENRRMKMSIQLLGIAALMILVGQRQFLLRISNVVLSVVFLYLAYAWLTNGFQEKEDRKKRDLTILVSVVFFILGIVPLIFENVTTVEYVKSLGTFSWIFGVAILVYGAYKKSQS